MGLLSRALDAFASWALSKNSPGSYKSEDDPRWAYTIATNGDPYLTRVLAPKWFARVFGCRPYLHKFHRKDIDRHLHSHPWQWALSIVLSGSYDETRVDHDATLLARGIRLITSREILTTTRRVSRFNYLTSDDYHKVDELHGDVWTLFITGPSIPGWGFLVDGVHVPDHLYLNKDD